MTKRYELTPFAKRNLVDIVIWTDENFGPAQADKYFDILLERCDGLANGKAQFQDCSVLTGARTKSGLLFTRAGRHFVLFRQTDDLIIILDFIHVASDLVNMIAKLDTGHP